MTVDGLYVHSDLEATLLPDDHPVGPEGLEGPLNRTQGPEGLGGLEGRKVPGVHQGLEGLEGLTARGRLSGIRVQIVRHPRPHRLHPRRSPSKGRWEARALDRQKE